MMRQQMSSGALLMLTAVVLVALNVQLARADLYTACAASIEWKVDSADAIYVARTSLENAEGARPRRYFEPTAVLKGKETLADFPSDSVSQCRLDQLLHLDNPGSAPGSEWLLFIRGAATEARIFAAVNLSSPTADWTVAAISCNSVKNDRVLTTSHQILAFVRERIRQKHTLPAYSDRDLTDELVSEESSKPLACWIAGETITVDIDLWEHDNGKGQDFDTWITDLLVPVGANRQEDHAPNTNWKSMTRQAFAAHADIQASLRNPRLSELEQNLVGTWRYQSGDRQLSLTLHPYGTCFFAVCSQSGRASSQPEHVLNSGMGTGSWEVRSGRLTIRQHLCIDSRPGRATTWNAIWLDLGGADPNDWSITQVTRTSLELAQGKTFTRQATPIRTFQYPHLHPWYLMPQD